MQERRDERHSQPGGHLVAFLPVKGRKRVCALPLPGSEEDDFASEASHEGNASLGRGVLDRGGC